MCICCNSLEVTATKPNFINITRQQSFYFHMSRSTSPGGFLYGLDRSQSLQQQRRHQSPDNRTVRRTMSHKLSSTKSQDSSPRLTTVSLGPSTRPTLSSIQNSTVTAQKRQRFMRLQRQRLGRYVKWVNLVLFDDMREDMIYFERRLHGYAFANFAPEPLTSDTFFNRLKDGLILCSLVDTLETTARMCYGDTNQSKQRLRDRIGPTLAGIHRKPATKTSCCENIEKALRVIWSKGVIASVSDTRFITHIP